MILYELSNYHIDDEKVSRPNRIGLYFSLERAKHIRGVQWVETDEAWYGHIDTFHVIIREIRTEDEPDFAALVGEAFYATAE